MKQVSSSLPLFEGEFYECIQNYPLPPYSLLMSKHCELTIHQDYDSYELSNVDEARIKPLMKQIVSNGYQFEYFVSTVYHHYCSYGLVQKHNRELRRSIRKFYKDDIKMIFFIEQHKSGSYHRHVLIEDACEGRWKDPSSKMQNFLKDSTEDYVACMVGSPSDDSKDDLLERCIRNMEFISNSRKSVDVERIFDLKKLVGYCTKQFEWFHPSYEVIDPVSSDIDISFYLHHKQYGTEWIKRDGVSSAESYPKLLLAQ